MKISKATFKNFDGIKDLMLKALSDDPYAFSVSFDEYSQNSDAWWHSYIDGYLIGLKDAMFIALENEKIVGMVGVLYDTKARKKHIASIVWLYVDQDNRGKGVGRSLMEEVLKKISEINTISKVSLLVNSKQEQAIKMYSSLGFKNNGMLERELNFDGEFIDSYIMEKLLN